MQSRTRILGLAALFAAALATPAVAGPPWISIELPANPYDRDTRGAFLLVHAFHHGTPVSFPVTGTAEGIVGGERRTITLEFVRTERDGVYALRKQWSAEGVWTLVIRANQGPNDAATAIVELGADGEVASVKVPTTREGSWTVPASVSAADIDAALRARAGALARRN
jgi:hypothetical protein